MNVFIFVILRSCIKYGIERCVALMGSAGLEKKLVWNPSCLPPPSFVCKLEVTLVKSYSEYGAPG